MKQNRFISKKAVTFRKWNNKSYAVFNSLKKVVHIGVLSAPYLLFANSNSATAHEADTTVARYYDLETVDVISNELPESISGISRVVVTISQKEIEQAAVSSVDELLEYAANIDIRQRGTHGMQSDISIRGGSFDQTLVLLNGMNITDPQTGHHNLNLPIDLSSIKRIEILKGPGAWKFGPGAFSGAINIVTQTPKNAFVKAQVEYGEHKLNKEILSAGFNIKNTSHLVSAKHSSSDGYIGNTDFKTRSLFYQGNINTRNSEFNIQAGATDRAFGANSFYSAKYPDQFEEIQTYFAAASYKTQIGRLLINPRAYFRRNNDRFLLFRENPAAYSNYHTTNVSGGNLLLNYMHATNATTTVGFDVRNEQIFSNNLGKSSPEPIISPVNDTILLDKTHQRTTFSTFIGHKRYFNKFMVNVGINLTYNTDLKNKWFMYPGIDVAYDLTPSVTWFASANKTMRMPTFTDLYYTSPNNEGNPNLLPEEASGYETGIRFEKNAIQASATLFAIRGENMIDWVRETTNDKWETINYTKLNTSGIELLSKVNLRGLLPSQRFLHSGSAAYTYITQEQAETRMISNYSLNYLKHRLDFNLKHAIWKNISANWHIAWQERNGEYEKFINTQSAGMVAYESFWTIDLKISWIKSGWNIYGEARNLADALYYDYGNVPQPGRWMKVGISKRFNF
ncbi:MAG: TonB-dependent receptor [Prolixibacteraceae bacterium]|jgi:vitamin B12 transporter|nr:TonB-dependent receptor [Prolixibacteraceae bacterium]